MKYLFAQICLCFFVIYPVYAQDTNEEGPLTDAVPVVSYDPDSVVENNGPQAIEGSIEFIHQATIDSLTQQNSLRISPEGYDVGSVPISTAVGSRGEFTASIPIDVMPGVGSIQPGLSLNYSSVGGNGVYGYGWGLAGISCISRRGSDVFHDGEVAPARIGAGVPQLMFDGMRLIHERTDSTRLIKTYQFYPEGSNKATLVTVEVSNPLKVTSIEVLFPNGQKGIYGQGYKNIMWFITELSDQFGNYMTFEYETGESKPLISTISYGGNQITGSPHFETVNFYYTNYRFDSYKVFEAGQAISEYRLLEKISSTKGSYFFHYTRSELMSSLLEQVTFQGGTGHYLPPLKFKYGKGDRGWDITSETSTLPQSFQGVDKDNLYVRTGKYNTGAEKEGIIMYPKKRASIPSAGGVMSEYSPKDKIIFIPEFESHLSSSYVMDVDTGFRQLLTMDIDNKLQKESIIKVNANGSKSPIFNVRFTISTPGPVGGLSQRTKSFDFPSKLYDSFMSKKYSPHIIDFYSGDFNGDGIQEVCGVQKKHIYGKYVTAFYFFNLDNEHVGADACYVLDNPIVIHHDDLVYFADYNGDGKMDLFHVHGAGVNIYSFERLSSNPNPLAVSMKQIATTSVINKTFFTEEKKEYDPEWTARRTLLLGDINGDGKTDMLATPYWGYKSGQPATMDGGRWIQCLSKGGSGVSFEETEYVTPYGWLSPDANLFLKDMNGDGKSDLVGHNGAGKNIQIWYSNGSQIGNFAQSSYDIDVNVGIMVSTDFNHSNPRQMLLCISNDKCSRLTVPFNEKESTLLTSVKNSYETEVKVDYAKIGEPIIAGGNKVRIHNPGAGAVFPYYNFDDYYWAVYQKKVFSTEDGNQILSNQAYSYYNAVIHAQGLGFCGFEKITENDLISGRSAVSYFDPFKFGVPKKAETHQSVVTNEYDIQITDKKEPQIRLIGQSSYSKITGDTVKVSNEYNSFGQITKTVTDWGEGLKEETNTSYLNDLGSYRRYVGLPESSSIKKYRGNETFSQSNQVSYIAGRPNETRESTNGLTTSVAGMVYDTRGNLIQKWVRPYDVPGSELSESYMYDNNGRFLIRETDALGFAKDFTYNSKGLLAQTNGHLNDTTRYVYDVYDRIQQVTYPDSTVTNTALQWEEYGPGIYSVTTFGTEKPTSIVYYDELGREVTATTQRFDNSYITVVKKYDHLGRLERKSQPYKQSPTGDVYIRYTYDNYDRLLSVKEPTGREEKYAYSGRSVTETKELVPRTRHFDTQGNMISVTDPGGTINYSLRPDGQPDSITVFGNVTTRFTYDLYGRQTSIDDPSAGIQTYEYDEKGNLKKETDANGNVMTSEYDRYNRAVKVIRPEFFTTYAYNPQGLLYSEVSSNGNSTVYRYDRIGRLSTESMGILRTVISPTKGYSYKGGKISSVVYIEGEGSGSVKEEYSYNNGHLTEIKVSGQYLSGQHSIWKLISENNYGVPTSVKSGMFTNEYYYYDKFITGRGTKKNNNYIFSEGGGVDVRTGNIGGMMDNYGIDYLYSYDSLNRLVEAGTNCSTYPIDYNNKGSKLSWDKSSCYSNDMKDIFKYDNQRDPYKITEAIFSEKTGLPPNHNITYNSLKRPSTIKMGASECRFTYYPSGERCTFYEEVIGASYSRSVYYAGNWYENVSKRTAYDTRHEERIYVGGDAYTAPAVYIRKYYESQGKLYYINRDQFNNIVQVFDSQGNTVQSLTKYDAWGRIINLNTYSPYKPEEEPDLFLDRGYSSHEHIRHFGLINMNARLYDPVLGSFLSPDPYVQAPDNTQSYNRYAYCFNNPLKYTDPSGEVIFTLLSSVFCPALLPIALQTDIGWMTGAMGSVSNGGSFWEGAWQGAVIGAINGAVDSGLSKLSALKLPLGSRFDLKVVPQFAIGTDGLGFGFNATLGCDLGRGFNVGVNFGGTYYGSATGTGASGFEGRLGYGVGYQLRNFKVGVGSTYFFSGETTQQNGQFYLGYKDLRVTYENDTWAPVPGLWSPGGMSRDRFRTAAAKIDIMGGPLKGLNAGLYIYSGLAKSHYNGVYNDPGADKYRMGALYLGYNCARLGFNSERGIRGPIQNGFHDIFSFPHFRVLDISNRFYYGFYSPNPYTVW